MKLFNFMKEKTKKLFGITAILAMVMQFAMPKIVQATDSPQPHFADELEFFVGRNLTQNQHQWVDPVNGNAGDEFKGELFVHNNIVGSVAEDVVVKVSIPSQTTNNKAVLSATESARNAASLSDTLTVNLNKDADIMFEPNSVKLFKVVGEDPVEVPLSFEQGNKLVTTGLFLGDIEGCFQFSKFITFEFKTKAKEVPKQPNLNVSKLVRNVTSGESNFVPSNQAHACDTLEYKLNFSNTGEIDALNVLLKDVIPPHTKFVSGSAVISINGGSEQVLANGDSLVGGGITLAKIESRENSYVKFRVVIDAGTKAGTVLINTVILDGLKATAQTTIVAEAVPVVVAPVTPSAAKPLPATGPVETASVIFASLLMGAYGFIKYRKHLAKEETKIISQLLNQ